MFKSSKSAELLGILESDEVLAYVGIVIISSTAIKHV